MNFDPTALAAAFEANAALGEAATGSAPAEDLASKEVQVVAADIGLDRVAANALMGACLIAAHEGTETDPQKIRRIPECSIIAVGMAFGVLAQLRAAAPPPVSVETLVAAIEANEAWSPPEPVDFAELTKDSLLPQAAYSAAADLGIDREQADEIGRAFFEHMAQLGFSVEEVRADPVGAAAGFSMFWGWLAAKREAEQAQ